jgi:hypothetical protein
MRYGGSLLLWHNAPVFLLLAHTLSPMATAHEVTFHKDIEPLVQKHCQACHRPGEAAPFSLLTYKDARPWAAAIKQAVSQRKMPPWFADSSHGEFRNDRRLNDGEIATILAWVEGGAKEGNAADAPPPLHFADGWKIGAPDLVLELPMAYSVPTTGTIDYIWFAVDMNLTEDKWIERVEVRPTDRSVVHHALVFARAPGGAYLKELLPGNSTVEKPDPESTGPQQGKGTFAVGNGFSADTEMIGDYVPNGDPFIAEADHARLVHAGSQLLFQIHYTTNGHATKDRTQVGIVFAKRPPRFRVVNDAVANVTLSVPPGAANHVVLATAEFQHDTVISNFGPHMHLRGKAMRYELLRAGSTTPEILLNVPHYDFNWQLKYNPVTPIAVKKRDILRITAWYDNSPNNPYNPDPKKQVHWGNQSWEEMLFAFFDFSIPADLDPSVVTGGLTPDNSPASNEKAAEKQAKR